MNKSISTISLARTNSNGLRPRAVVIATPWARSGSSNIFEAQTSSLADAGLEVALLVGPAEYWYSDYDSQLLADIQEAFNWPSVSLLSWDSFGRNAKAARLKGRLRWMLAKRDSELKIQARMALDTSFSKVFKEFLLAHDIEIIYANHVFQIMLAEKVAAFPISNSRARPEIIVETHDIQSSLNIKSLRRNTFSRVPDFYHQLIRDEVSLLSKADKITHLSVDDMAFFSSLLPSKKHFLIPPTLSPAVERKLTAIRSASSPKLIDFLWVGNDNPGNIQSVQWFFEYVMPHLSGDLIINFVGTIRRYFIKDESQIIAKYGHMLLGEVADVAPFYEAAKAVIVPVVFGTGVSIKFVESICMGKPIVATPLAFRGLSKALIERLPIKTAMPPIGFARAMMQVHEDAEYAEPQYSRFYDEHLSNKRFDELLSAATGLHRGR